jgi:hypothetical protein
VNYIDSKRQLEHKKSRTFFWSFMLIVKTHQPGAVCRPSEYLVPSNSAKCCQPKLPVTRTSSFYLRISLLLFLTMFLGIPFLYPNLLTYKLIIDDKLESSSQYISNCSIPLALRCGHTCRTLCGDSFVSEKWRAGRVQ